jgi:primosomal protein N' (replication factor Y)
MLAGEVDILIGTQMIAKGHHFPKLEFVGIIDADLGLAGGDLRAMERTYQILHQVAGRAGREERLGKVLVQTYMPDNSALKALIAHDRAAFLHNEMEQRRKFHMPPYYRLATVTLSGKLEKHVQNKINELARIAPQAAHIDVLGPAPAQMSYLRNQYRYRLIVRMPVKMSIQRYLDAWLAKVKIPSAMTLRVDIDPYNFM